MRNQTHLNYEEGWLGERAFLLFLTNVLPFYWKTGFFIQKDPLSGILTKS